MSQTDPVGNPNESAALPEQSPEQSNGDERILIEWLSQHNEACPVCKYNLRSLTSSKCPECGWELQLRVGTKDAILGSWIGTLVSVCIGAGLGIPSIIALIMSQGEVFRGRFTCGGICMIWFSMCIPLAIGLLIGKRRFIRMSADSQRGFAIFTGFMKSLAILAMLAFFLFS